MLHASIHGPLDYIWAKDGQRWSEMVSRSLEGDEIRLRLQIAIRYSFPLKFQKQTKCQKPNS